MERRARGLVLFILSLTIAGAPRGAHAAEDGAEYQQKAGLTTSFGAGGKDVYVVRTDASGNELAHKTYGGTGDDLANSFLKAADGTYLIAGSTTSSGAGGQDIYVINLPAVCQ